MDLGPRARPGLLLKLKIFHLWIRLGLLVQNKLLNKGARVPQSCCSFLNHITRFCEVETSLIDL